MIASQKILRVFLASPSDMPEERRYARECIDEWNDVNAERSGWFVDLMGWEDTLPQAGRPQELINEDVARCMMFVGMMYQLWGNPTGSGHTSGFHEEFLLAQDRYEKTKEPSISLFFKDIGKSNDPGEQLRQVIDFKKEITDSKKYFYKSLSADASEWQSAFRRVVHRLIFKVTGDYDLKYASESGDSEGSDHSSTSLQQSLPAVGSRLRITAAKKIIDEIENVGTDYDVSPLDIARLRLVGIGWRSAGLSEMTIGTHDANLIYRNVDNTAISGPERSGLVDCGLAHLASQNAPLWKWVYADKDQVRNIRIDAIFSSEDSLKSGAFSFLSLISDDLGEYGDFLKSQFPSFSFAAKNAALRYIGSVGDSEFLSLCSEELEKSEAATLNEALLAIIAIKFRDSPSEALTFLIEENRYPSGEWKHRSAVLASMGELSDITIEKGLSHRDAGVRAMAVQALGNRKPLPADLSSDLRSDPSAKVRMAAVEVALLAGETLSLEDIAKIIVRTEKNALGPVRKVGEDEYAKIREIVFRDMSDADLEKELGSFYTPAEAAYSTLLLRHWKQRVKKARQDLSDGFSSHYEKIKLDHAARFGEIGAASTIPSDSVLQYVAAKMIRSTLDIFAKKGEAEDIRFFRSATSQKYYVLSADDLSFFSKHGQWSDINLIASANRSTGINLFSDNGVSDKQVATAIQKIAGNRLMECLNLDISYGIKSAILQVYPQGAFRSLPDSVIISLLNEQNDSMRKWAAVKACESLSRERVKTIMSTYLSQSYLYYNVIHWLDLKLSAPSQIARLVAAHR